MKKDDREILVEVQKNSQMAVKEIDTISEKTCDDIMRYELVKEKNYFVVTTCIDGHIENAGFNSEKIVQPCGNYKKLQCSEKCCSDLRDATETVVDITNRLESSERLKGIEQPVCPHCGKPMAFNNIMSENYVEEGYLPQWEKYTKWLSDRKVTDGIRKTRKSKKR